MWTESFQKRFNGLIPVNSEIRNRIISQNNTKDFYVRKSCMAPNENGLYANIEFEKGELLGIYRGEKCKITDFINAKKSNANYNEFLEKYNIKTTLNSKTTKELIEKLGYILNENTFLVMPRYPIDPNWYLGYNAMLFVNEPPNKNQVWNTMTQKYQPCEINVLSYINFKWNTIDYVAAKTIKPNEELVVYYGNKYLRETYEINEEGCNKLDNKIFF
jgi:hypothetical protein